MAVTIEQVAWYARLSGPDGIGTLYEDDREAMTGHLAVADELVKKYAPEAPEHVRNQATIQCASYLYSGWNGSKPPPDALRHSGAVSLLSRWRVHRAGVVREAEGGA